jgi:hypothetical protein
MADKSMQLVIGVDIKDVNAAINKTKALESQVKRIVDAHRSGKIDIEKYNKGLLQTKRAYDSISPSSQKATAEVRKLAKEFNIAYDTQQQVANIKRLEAEQTRAFAAARREATLINQQKIMEAKAAAKAVSDAAKQEVAAFRAARKEAELMNKQFDMERAAAGLTQMKNRSNSTGVAVQQLGYQVGDFMVQVQGGTNAFVAFGQQATQLVGVLPLVATQLGLTTMAAIGISTVLGIAIPLITAVGAAWWRSSQESKKAKEELDDLDSSLEAIDKTLRDWVLSKKAAQAGVTVEELLGTQGIKKAQKDLDDAKAKLEKVRLLSAVNIPAGEAGAGVALAGWFAELTATNNLTEATAEYEKALDRVRELQEKQADERNDLYVDEERNIKQQLALQKVATEKGESSAEYLRLQADQRKLNTAEQIKSLKIEEWQKKILIDLNNELIDGAAVLDKSNQELEIRLKLLQKAEEAEQSAAKYTKGTVTQLNNQAAVLETSIKSKQAIAALNRQQFMFAQAGKSLSIDELNAIMAAYDNLQKVTAETVAFKDEAKETKEILEGIEKVINGINSSISSLELSAIGDAARLAALKAGKSIEESRMEGKVAEKVATTQAQFEAANVSSLPDGPRRAAEEAHRREIELLRQQPGMAAEIQRLEDKKRKSQKEDPAIKMLQEIERRKVLIGLTEEQAKRQELVYQTEDKLGEFREKYGNDFINNIVKQTMALDEQQKVLDKAKEQQKEIGDLISSSMEDAFMSIVDGTKSVKDAFKSMAASVISELYRILVIKKIVGGITGFLPFADGGVFSGGSVVPSAKGNAFYGGNVIPFAKGGVVGSPMMFPMAGGNTGLMGEAGPEAIMPLKRGKGGKLGVVAENNGNVVINQSFNFSANGDESVKKIIAQAAPQIAQMTKTSIINDRRRGGSTLAAFGR